MLAMLPMPFSLFGNYNGHFASRRGLWDYHDRHLPACRPVNASCDPLFPQVFIALAENRRLCVVSRWKCFFPIVLALLNNPR